MYKGKAIYNPSGKAGEYSEWACNFYVGCTHECAYCYLKEGRGAKILGGNIPKLKKCFKSEGHAFNIFEKELRKNLEYIRMSGLYFTFTSDPFLTETINLTISAVELCNALRVPVKLLSKGNCFGELDNPDNNYKRSIIAIGFTLTGHDVLEPFASPNKERIQSMKMFKELGYKIISSIEPIIDFESSKEMIRQALPYCDLFKVGLKSGKKYDVVEAQTFVEWLDNEFDLTGTKIYLKESLQKLTHYRNSELGNHFVGRDYNIFNTLK